MAGSATATLAAWCSKACCKPVCAPVWSAATFATDASVIEADARVMRRTEGKEPPDDWNDPANIPRPVREYLAQLDKAAGLGALPGESRPAGRPYCPLRVGLHRSRTTSGRWSHV